MREQIANLIMKHLHDKMSEKHLDPIDLKLHDVADEILSLVEQIEDDEWVKSEIDDILKMK